MAYLQPAPTLIQKSGSTLHKPWGRVLVSQALTTCCDPQLSLILRHFNYGTSARFCLNTIHKNKGILVQALRYFLSSHIKEVGTLGLSWFFFFFFWWVPSPKNIFPWVIYFLGKSKPQMSFSGLTYTLWICWELWMQMLSSRNIFLISCSIFSTASHPTFSLAGLPLLISHSCPKSRTVSLHCDTIANYEQILLLIP